MIEFTRKYANNDQACEDFFFLFKLCFSTYMRISQIMLVMDGRVLLLRGTQNLKVLYSLENCSFYHLLLH